MDRHIRRLDEDLAKFEEEQMTGPKFISSSNLKSDKKHLDKRQLCEFF